MDPTLLRPCPFCAHPEPFVATTATPEGERTAVMCPECGAVGPLALATANPAHAIHMWNQRFGEEDSPRSMAAN